jgi:glycine/sarcosine N-methyltransferase
MNNFYKSLVNHYDTIFPAEPEIVSFLAGSLEGRGRVLDIACGTGSYSLELAALGFEVTGIDLDKDMIERAKEKTGSMNAIFHLADMTYLGDPADEAGKTPLFDKPFDGAYCVGNSLPHLSDRSQVTAALSAWYSCLAPGGVLVVQTVNFGRFRPGGETELPSIISGDMVFSRRYAAAKSGTVDFIASLKVPGEEKELENTVRLLTLDRDTVDLTLREAGFANMEYFGNYGGEDYDEKRSFLMICRARKP